MIFRSDTVVYRDNYSGKFTFEGLTDKALDQLAVDAKTEIDRRETSRKAVEFARQEEARSIAWHKRGKEGMQGLINAITGVIHAMACHRQMCYWKFGQPTPAGVINGNWSLFDVAAATKAYGERKVRSKTADPVDAKAPWLRTAEEHLAYKLRSSTDPVLKSLIEKQKAQTIKSRPSYGGGSLNW